MTKVSFYPIRVSHDCPDWIKVPYSFGSVSQWSKTQWVFMCKIVLLNNYIPFDHAPLYSIRYKNLRSLALRDSDREHFCLIIWGVSNWCVTFALKYVSHRFRSLTLLQYSMSNCWTYLFLIDFSYHQRLCSMGDSCCTDNSCFCILAIS